MSLDATTTIDRLKEHLKASEFPAADVVVEEMIAELARGGATFDKGQRKAVLGALRSARRFEALGRMAQALLLAGHDDPAAAEFDPMVRRQYAQSLIEQDQIAAAQDTLLAGMPLIASVPEERYQGYRAELVEMQGLLGRVYKQRYVDAIACGAASAVAEPLLRKAGDWYDAASRGRKVAAAHWPLVNLIAVIARAERDGLSPLSKTPSQDLARAVIRELLPEAQSNAPADPGDQPWLRASLGECYVAVRDWPQAARWYATYAAEPYVNAFELASARRQLVEVWQIDPDSKGGDAQLVRLLDAALSGKPGGAIILDQALARSVADGDGLVRQSIIGANMPATLVWIEEGLKRAPSVAGVFPKGKSEPIGSAFVVDGDKLHPGLAGRRVAVTAAHVVSRFADLLLPRDAVLRFTRHATPGLEFEVKELYASPVQALDFCVLELFGPVDELSPLQVRAHETSPTRFADLSKSKRACSTIGHADGKGLALSHSEFSDIGPKRKKAQHHIFLHYTASTLGGNSGGPVYDDDWNVIGLHQAGIRPEMMKDGIENLSGDGNTHVANEGISLATIARELGSSWVTAPVVRQASESMQTKLQQLEAAILAAETPESTIAALFEDMDEADFHAAPTAAAASGDGTHREAYRNAGDLFWYGGAVILSKAFRTRRNSGFADSRKRGGHGLAFVSEGDSWFQYPLPGVRDVIDHLSDRYPIYCRAIAGMEFEKIFANTTELMAAIGDHKPDGVLLSGGGNDLLGDGLIVNFVKDFDAKLQPTDYLEKKLDRKIDGIVELFDELVDKALKIDPKLKFFLHGYDRALPKRGQNWLDVPLKRQRSIDNRELQKRIVAAIVDAFNVRLAAFADKRPGVVRYVDCRGVVGESAEDWRDELHPKTAGFGRVADEFDRAIRTVFKDHPSIRRDPRNLV